jgi:MFS family permease
VRSLRSGTFAPFAHRDFALFSAASVVSNAGFTVQSLARVWLLQETTHSPFVIGLAAALTGLPVLVFSLFGGYLGDRFSRKSVTVLTEVVTVAAAGLLAGLAAAGAVETWHVLSLAAAQGAAMAVALPVKQTLLTDLVPEHQQRAALGVSALVGNVAGIIGPAIGGLALTFAGTPATLVTGTVIAAAAVLFYIPMKAGDNTRAGRPRASVVGDLREGVRYSLRDPFIRWLMVLTVVMLSALSTRGVVYPAIVQDELGHGAGTLSVLEIAGGIGALFGPLIFVWVSPKLGDLRLLLVSGVLFAMTVAGFAASSWIAALAAFSALSTCLGQVFFVTNWTAMQLRPPQEFRARVVSVRFVLTGVQPAGLLGLGALAELMGPREALLVFAGAGAALFGLSLVLVPPWERQRSRA